MTPSLRARVGLGLLIGVVVSGLEINGLPLAGLSPRDQLSASIPMVLCWCGSAVTGSLVAFWLEPRLSTWPFIGAMAALFGVLAATTESAMGAISDLGFGMQAFLGAEPDRLGLWLHTLWVHGLYGGLAVGALVGARRGARMQAVLGHSVVAARESKARLDAAAAKALRGQIQPERLTALIEELRARYAQDLERGDRLLERLTDFLRAAMPSVRSGTSTLSQELETLQAYGRLMAEVEPAGAGWTFRRPRGAPDTAFPPLVLLPAAEALAAGGRLDVRLSAVGAGLELSMTAAGGALPQDLNAQLRASLRAVFGDRATMSADGPSLKITMRQPKLATA